MTRQEISRRYQIPLDVLLAYEQWTFCGAAGQRADARQYDDSDLERLSTVMTLLEIGFCMPEAEAYLRLALEGVPADARRLRMLEARRGAILEEIHGRERQLQRLDCLRHALRTAHGGGTE